MVHDDSQKPPLTSLVVIGDRSRLPGGFELIRKCYDDLNQEADLWKEGFLSFKSVYRYLAVSRIYPPSTFIFNVIIDLAVANDSDSIPTGFTPIETTEDTRERALRKKIICIRTMPRDTAVDAVCDVIMLGKQKKPPMGYSLAGDIDGLLLCFKYGSLSCSASTGDLSRNSMNPALPYPLHPSVQNSNSNPNLVNSAGGRGDRLSLVTGQMSLNGPSASSGVLMSPGIRTQIDGVPFELNPLLEASRNQGQLQIPELPEINSSRLRAEFSYPFSVEQNVLLSAG